MLTTCTATQYPCQMSIPHMDDAVCSALLVGQPAALLRSAVARILTYSDSEGDDDDGEAPLKARPPPELPEARKPGGAEGNVLGARTSMESSYDCHAHRGRRVPTV